MHQYKGKLIVHTGSMFSGKTSSLEKDIKRFQIAGYKTMVFKPGVDTRYKKDAIVTHDNTSLSAIIIDGISDIEEQSIKNGAEVIGIDEIQFFSGDVAKIIKGITNLLNRGITVIIAGLDMDFSGNPFEIVKELMPISDYLNKHHAVCTMCGADAWISHRKIKNKERLVIGASEEYEPLCRCCYNKINK